jgi:uncharacterized protein (TIGR00251 family)
MLIIDEVHFRDGRSGCVITIRATPRSSQNEITGIMSDGTIKLRLRKAPVENQANQELIKYFSKILNLPLSNIEILLGQAHRKKVIAIFGMEQGIIRKIILSQVKANIT